MQLRTFIRIILLLCTTFTYSQHSIIGTVVGDGNIPQNQALVQVKQITNDETIAYGFTDELGKFSLKTTRKGTFNLKISGLGFKTSLQKINILEKQLLLETIVVTQNNIELETVIVKQEASGIIEVGDTLKYRIEKFMNGTEDNLKDVIKKLPGLEVDANGKIKANGKEVDKILIDGEEFFTNQQKVATDNISAEMIKNIELIKNYTEFKNINQNKSSALTAININIKEKFRNKITGNASLGIGNKNYRLHATLFNFSKKKLVSLISNSNNTGELSINLEDYLTLTHLNENNTTIGETTFAKNDDLPRFITIGNSAKERASYFTGFNYKYIPNKNTQISLYSIFNTADQIEEQINLQYFQTNTSSFTNKDSRTINEETFFSNAALSALYKPSTNKLFNYSASFSGLSRTSITAIENNNNILNNNSVLKDYNLNQQLSYTTIFKNKTSLTAGINNNTIKKSNVLDIMSNDPFLDLNFSSNNDYKILQKTTLTKNNINFNINYAFKVSKISNSLSAEASHNLAKFHSEEEQFNQFNNYISNKNYIINLAFETIFQITRKTRFTAKLAYSKIDFLMNDLKSTSSVFAPQINFKTDFNSNHYIKLSYSRNNKLLQAENFITNKTISDYRTIYNNQDIAFNSIFPNNQFSIDYFYNSYSKKISIISNHSYYKATDILSNNSFTNATTNFISYKLAPFEERLNSMLFAEKTLVAYPFSLRTSVSFTASKKDFFTENNKQYLKNISITSYASFISRFKDKRLQFETGIVYSKDNYTNALISNKISTLYPFLETNCKIAKNISFVTKFSYKKINSSSNIDDIYQLDPSLRINFPKSKCEISIIGNNILNINNYSQTSISRYDNYTEERISQSLAGYFLVNIKFKL